MKKVPWFIACSIALTVLFYMLAYYLLPPPPPSAGMMLLFAAVAMVIVWAIGKAVSKFRSRRGGGAGAAGGKSTGSKTNVVVAFLLLGLLSSANQEQAQISTSKGTSTLCHFTAGPLKGKTRDLAPRPAVEVGSSCSDGAGSAGVITAPLSVDQPWYGSPFPGGGGRNGGKSHGGSGSGPEKPGPGPGQGQGKGQGGPLPVPVGSAPPPPPRAGDGKGGESVPRVTGTAILLPTETEKPGYGLYSYALVSHHPQPADLPKFKAYFRALLELPTAEGVARYVPITRINITYLPLDAAAPTWASMSLDDKIGYAIDHYDYARGEVMLASLSKHTGAGPVIISLLKPLDLSEHPRPVLVQDLTAAEPSLMESYVSYFVGQAAKDDFWQEKTLAHFSLNLRNGLEVAAEGLGMSKTAVDNWVSYFK